MNSKIHLSRQRNPIIPMTSLESWECRIWTPLYATGSWAFLLGSPWGCMFSPMLFTLLTPTLQQCKAPNHIIEFSDCRGGWWVWSVGTTRSGTERRYNRLVQCQQPFAECGQNKGDGCWVQESMLWSLSTDQWILSGTSCCPSTPAPLPRKPSNISTVYRGTVEGLLCDHIMAWLRNCTASEGKTSSKDYQGPSSFSLCHGI